MRRTTAILVCLILSAALGPSTETAERVSPGSGVDDGARAGRQTLDSPAGRHLSAVTWRDTGYRLPEEQRLSVTYLGEETLLAALTDGLAEPTTLAAGDFDGDGVADLVCGYAGPLGSFVTLHRGNVNAIYSAGSGPHPPFLETAQVFAVPSRPDFLATGDFDNDGRLDLVLAPKGGTNLHLLSGDGQGALVPSASVGLGGALTALIAGEINRPDGLVDLVAAIEHEDTASLLVFEGPGGALEADPEILPLPATASGLALGQLDADEVGRDLAVAAGPQLLIVQGRNRWLTLGEARQAEVADPLVRSIDLPASARDVAVGDFLQEADHRSELAVLLEDGSVSLLAREDAGGWHSAAERSVSAIGRPQLLAARLSGQPTHELVVVDPGDRRLDLLRGGDSRSFRLERHADLDARPVAALPMRLNRDAIEDLVVLLPDAAAPVVMPSGAGVTLTVRSHLDGIDELPGDGVCSTSGIDPSTCTLRAAILEANALAGADTIDFGITSGSTVITPNPSLPVITEDATIDATTQGGYSDSPIVEVDGSLASFDGLAISAGTSTVRGLAIQRFPDDGIRLFVNGNNIIEGNFIGTDVTGREDRGNGRYGVGIGNSASNIVGGTTQAARNLLSGNDRRGVNITGVGSTGNQVLGNLIGTDVTGDSALGNTYDGIAVWDGASQNTIGGTSTGAGNVISGNIRGLSFWYGTANQVMGNLIGTDVDGDSALGNLYVNLWVASDLAGGLSHDNLIGGTAVGAANVISACLDDSNIVVNEGSWNNQFLGNLMGTDITGTQDLGAVQYDGMSIIDSPDNVVGGAVPGARNVISGNGDYGVSVWYAASTGNQILGNHIGTDITGTEALGNVAHGIYVQNAPGNTFGGISEGAGNLISGNGAHGIDILNPQSTGNQILGNLIGTDVTGTSALGNLAAGVRIRASASSNVIGGTTSAARNVISANATFGVVLVSGASNNQIVGNRIGTDAAGTSALSNGFSGVIVQDAPDNIIGGSEAGAGNLISGNGEAGVYVINPASTGNSVTGNQIGTDVEGNPILGNGAAGVGIWYCSGTTVGGTSAEAANVIAGNARGVAVGGDSTTMDNSILGNSIFDNLELGIDLDPPDGITPNDPMDADTGPNGLQNFPYLTSVSASPTGVTIQGGLNSQATGRYRVEFFTSSVCDDSGYGEAERYLGFTEVITDFSGSGSFNVVLPAPVSDGDMIATTATDADGNTSEFCGCVEASCSSLATFSWTINALDTDTWGWTAAADVRFVKGDLRHVDSYVTTDDGTLFDATSLDMSMDAPGVGSGMYYVVRPLGCGSWQTVDGAQPARDATLP
jgi:hypothetical protein